MKSNRLKSREYGFTLIELMMVVVILAILASIALPRYDLFTQRARQSTAKGTLGILRTAIGIYYSDHEGVYPMQGYADGLPTESLSQWISPKYIEKIPVPRLGDRAPDFNGLVGLSYDTEANQNMTMYTPVRDVFLYHGAPGPAPFVNRPYVYDATVGFLYICNDNFDTAGNSFFNW